MIIDERDTQWLHPLAFLVHDVTGPLVKIHVPKFAVERVGLNTPPKRT